MCFHDATALSASGTLDGGEPNKLIARHVPPVSRSQSPPDSHPTIVIPAASPATEVLAAAPYETPHIEPLGSDTLRHC